MSPNQIIKVFEVHDNYIGKEKPSKFLTGKNMVRFLCWYSMPVASVNDGLDREKVNNQFLATEIVLKDVWPNPGH